MDFAIQNRSIKKKGLTRVLYAVKSDFTTLAEPPASPSTQAEKVTISTNHAFAEGNGFREAWVNLDTSKLDLEISGSRYSKSGKAKLSMMIPGDSANISAFVQDDPELIILVQQNPCQSGAYWQIGTKCQGANIAAGAKWTSGAQEGDDMGWEIPIEANQSSVLYYTGTVTMAD